MESIQTEAAAIFVIDDNEWHNLMIEKMLDDKGYVVQTFTSAQTMLDELKQNSPHLIISDIDMPELDGFELLEKIRQIPSTRDTAILYVSSLAREEVETDITKVGAEFLQKPVVEDSLQKMVARELKLAG